MKELAIYYLKALHADNDDITKRKYLLFSAYKAKII